MFSSISTRIVKTSATALVLAGIGIGLAGGGAANAQPIKLGDGTPCTDASGNSVPEGTIGKDRWGVTYVCISGKWEPAPQAFEVSPSIKGTRAPRATLSAR